MLACFSLISGNPQLLGCKCVNLTFDIQTHFPCFSSNARKTWLNSEYHIRFILTYQLRISCKSSRGSRELDRGNSLAIGVLVCNMYVYKPVICISLYVTACWGDFNSKQLPRKKFLQNPFLGCQWSVLEGKRNFCTVEATT